MSLINVPSCHTGSTSSASCGASQPGSAQRQLVVRCWQEHAAWELSDEPVLPRIQPASILRNDA